MGRALLAILPTLLYIGLLVYALADLIRTDESRVRGIPKMIWIFLIILIPIAGAIVWIFFGKEPVEQSSFGPPPQQQRRRPVAPDDDVDFLHSIDREISREQRLRELEERLKEVESDDDERDGKS